MIGYKNNPRVLSPEQEDLLRMSIKEFGDLSGITHDINTDEIITGNQRSKTIDINSCEIQIVKKNSKPDKFGTIAYGFIDTDKGKLFYRQVDWTEQQIERACIAANKLGGIWDYVKLSESFDISELEKWGFLKQEIMYIKNITFDFQDWDKPEKPKKEKKNKATTAVKIGRFRIMVDSEVLAQWMDKLEAKFNYNSKEIREHVKKSIFR
jgi:hypothetical protein